MSSTKQKSRGPPAIMTKASQVVPILARVLFPEALLRLAPTCVSLRKSIERNIDWEDKVKRFAKGPIASFTQAFEVFHLPPSFWRREYIFRFRASNHKCSLCGALPIYTEGTFWSERALKFCIRCWEENAWDEEKMQESLDRTLSKEVFENMTEMEIMIMPSFVVLGCPFYLKTDLQELVSLMSGADLKKPVDIFNNPWREQVRLALVNAGMDPNRAESFATNIFPPDGTPLTQIISTILHSSPEFTEMAMEMLQVKSNEADSMEETSQVEAPLSPDSQLLVQTAEKTLKKETNTLKKAKELDQESEEEIEIEDHKEDDKKKRRMKETQRKARKVMKVDEDATPSHVSPLLYSETMVTTEEDFDTSLPSLSLPKSSTKVSDSFPINDSHEDNDMDMDEELEKYVATSNLKAQGRLEDPMDFEAIPEVSKVSSKPFPKPFGDSGNGSLNQPNNLQSFGNNSDSGRITLDLPNKREKELNEAMDAKGIPWSRTQTIPFKTNIEQFLAGKGTYTLETLVEMLDTAAFKHDSLLAALDAIALKDRTSYPPF